MSTSLSPKQAAQYLGVSCQTLKTWRRLRKGPPFLRVGTRVRYELEGIRGWAHSHSMNRRVLTDELREQARAALAAALRRVTETLGRESKHRLAILTATGDVALACEGAPWIAEFGGQVFPDGDPTKPDKATAAAALECEVLRRLRGESVVICEDLYAAMSAEPGQAAWSERFTEGGPLFFCAKARSVSRFACVEMGPLVHEAFAGFEMSRQLHDALAGLPGGPL